MAAGPVDVYIIGFPGNNFSGRIAPAILELVETGTIRVLDLLFVMKDADGTVTTIEAADLDEDGAAFLSIDTAQPGALGDETAHHLRRPWRLRSAGVVRPLASPAVLDGETRLTAGPHQSLQIL